MLSTGTTLGGAGAEPSRGLSPGASYPPQNQQEAAAAASPAVPAAKYLDLDCLAALQPLSSLARAVPGVVEWKSGAFSPVVRVDGTIVCAGCLGGAGKAYRRSRSLKRNGDGQQQLTATQQRANAIRTSTAIVLLEAPHETDGTRMRVGLMVKPNCGFDEFLAVLLRQNQNSASSAVGGCVGGHVSLEGYVEKTKVPFLLKGSGGGALVQEHAGRLLPVLLHPRRLRWVRSPQSQAPLHSAEPVWLNWAMPDCKDKMPPQQGCFGAGLTGAPVTALDSYWLAKLSDAKIGAGPLGTQYLLTASFSLCIS